MLYSRSLLVIYFIFKILFIDCVASLLLGGLFSSFGEWWLLSSCSARASQCGGLSRCRAQALEQAGFSSCDTCA